MTKEQQKLENKITGIEQEISSNQDLHQGSDVRELINKLEEWEAELLQIDIDLRGNK